MPSKDVAPGGARANPARAPTIAFEWELAIFRGIRALYKRLVSGRASADETRAARFAERERHLGIVLQLIAGCPVRLSAHEGEGGLTGTMVTLPRTIALGPDPEANARLYLMRAVLAGAMVATDPRRAPAENRLDQVHAELERVERALAHLAESFPAFAEPWAEACRLVLSARATVDGDEVEQQVERLRVSLLRRGAGGPVEVAEVAPLKASESVLLWGVVVDDDTPVAARTAGPHLPDARPPAEITSEAEAPHVGAVELVELDEKELEDAVLQHTFEKIDTADEHRGGARDLDGADELDEQLEALDEVKLGKMIRTDEETSSLLRADIDLSAEVPDVATIEKGERGIPYDEWDLKTRSYKKAWCTVYPTALQRRDPRWANAAMARNRRVIDDVLRRVHIQRARLAPQRRQRDGDHVDLDAMVQHLADLRAGREDAPKLYTRRARLAHHVATTVLLDLSLSSDAWVDDRRVLDVSREAVLVLGEVAEKLGDEVRVIAFASHTRNKCRVFDVRRWGESWSIARARLGALVPQGYTRIGPALRYAIDEVCLPDAQRRLVLMITDGKPTDYDRYEGAHGIEDVRQAVREASRRGVWVHGLTVDTVARGYFPAMLGAGHWEILPRITALPEALASVYARMASG